MLGHLRMTKKFLTPPPIETIFLSAISVEGVLEAQAEREMAGASVRGSQPRAGEASGNRPRALRRAAGPLSRGREPGNRLRVTAGMEIGRAGRNARAEHLGSTVLKLKER